MRKGDVQFLGTRRDRDETRDSQRLEKWGMFRETRRRSPLFNSFEETSDLSSYKLTVELILVCLSFCNFQNMALSLVGYRAYCDSIDMKCPWAAREIEYSERVKNPPNMLYAKSESSVIDEEDAERGDIERDFVTPTKRQRWEECGLVARANSEELPHNPEWDLPPPAPRKKPNPETIEHTGARDVRLFH